MKPSRMGLYISMIVVWHLHGALAMNSALAAAASSSLQAYLASSPFTTRSAPAPTATTNLTALRAAVLAGNYSSRLDSATRNRCPQPCTSNSSDWYLYHSLDRLAVCNNTMLLDFSLFNQIDDPKTHVSIAACTANMEYTSSPVTNVTCQSNAVQQTEVTSSLQMASSGTLSASVSDVVAALKQLQIFSTSAIDLCDETINFAYSGSAAVGIYVGSGLSSQGVISSIIGRLSSQIQSDGNVAENLLVQLCDNSTARYSMGIFVNTNSDISSVQLGVQSWKNSSCITYVDGFVNSTWQSVKFLAPSLLNSNTSASVNTIGKNVTTLSSRSSLRSSHKLNLRDSCTTVKVVAGDTCATLAAECGITPAAFSQYNPSATECSSLTTGEYVCCSAGTLPDNTPQPSANGDCYAYLVVAGDSCSSLAASYDITEDDIMTWNTNTWGWNGCSNLLAGNNMCLSSGYPPMPPNIANAVCGPQVNGTATAPQGSDLSTLNECPLNACCDIWGQCGTTTEFCTPSNSTTGAPGTAASGQNGCISNCGTDISITDAPSEFYSIAYFEAFDWSRPCLTMSVNDINTTAYTHIHFAFATLNADFSINVTSIADQLPFLQGLSGVKRIISFGGWAFCTDPSTYMIMRDAVSTSENIATLVKNVIAFVEEYDLDGIDWDWEYPDEPDIPGIPVGTEADSTGYFVLLDELKASMPTGKTVSITAPASYWYLQHFPIQAMSEFLDYVMFMTYDLHGQWDYGNVNSDTGCLGGNCLRSHVNMTETINALSMITKAGVLSNMIAVGVSSYGRSFEMTTPGCWTELCTYTGPLSGATPGPCTDTAGYIADYEIGLVSSENPTADLLWDEASYSNIMVYNQTQWVAYMNDTNKAVRQLLYKDLSLFGTSDWAVDLQSLDGTGESSSSSSTSSSISNLNETVYISPDIWSSEDPVVTALPGDARLAPDAFVKYHYDHFPTMDYHSIIFKPDDTHEHSY
ncbi:hypothetical protein BGAL_0095g00320 [Botrytis galanthina]|uniref:chitinase n=1 Tax=Botrytis galanthina TaxID=278940 RepID=A0A4V4HV63_9HELO|nr:hypothetical protein BGAL_0095g00320 [Botrytis galanthina]